MNLHNINLNFEENGGLDQRIFKVLVAERAQFKASRRGNQEDHQLDDWLEAEREIRNQCHYWHVESH